MFLRACSPQPTAWGDTGAGGSLGWRQHRGKPPPAGLGQGQAHRPPRSPSSSWGVLRVPSALPAPLQKVQVGGRLGVGARHSNMQAGESGGWPGPCPRAHTPIRSLSPRTRTWPQVPDATQGRQGHAGVLTHAGGGTFLSGFAFWVLQGEDLVFLPRCKQDQGSAESPGSASSVSGERCGRAGAPPGGPRQQGSHSRQRGVCPTAQARPGTRPPVGRALGAGTQPRPPPRPTATLGAPGLPWPLSPRWAGLLLPPGSRGAEGQREPLWTPGPPARPPHEGLARATALETPPHTHGAFGPPNADQTR